MTDDDVILEARMLAQEEKGWDDTDEYVDDSF